ncbi:MAG TPA: VOC family protein [Candidatus Saccharimonadales bacterium]|jgi:predicted enzyme related to lactoylglutathione lyase
MFKDTKAFSGFSVSDITTAKVFYGTVLGLEIEELKKPMPMLLLHLATGGDVLVYPKGDDHTPATYTVLNFPVSDINAAVQELTSKGVDFIHLENDDMPQDEMGIMRGLSANMGPDIAWFKDPAGNVLAILQES